ncbi:MAG: FG-GAP repeat protein, partial [Planctomycetes bacterium]|nr:FG-GAP repeat protein [Planctomycetota bacterium]
MLRILHGAMVPVGLVVLLGPGFGSPVTLGQECSETKLLASDGASGDYFGLSVAIGGDVAVVGAHEDDDNGEDSGSAYIYRFDGIRWIEEAKLLASDGASDDQFGASVAVAGDVAVVGAFADDDNGDDSGSAYIYRFDGREWIEEAKLLASDGAEDDLFGASVALDAHRVFVGALGDDDNGSGSGSAYVYRFDGTDWIEEGKLLASDGVNGDHFGLPVAVSGDVVVVGASFVDDNGENSGSAYVFRFEPDESRWVEEAKLLASDGASDDYFGNPVRISGDVAIVGAFADDDNGDDSGSAYVFRFDGTGWIEEAKLLASDGTSDDFFGYSVDVSGDLAAVGAIYGVNPLMSATGAVYVYLFDGTEWTQEDKLLAPDGVSGDLFGGSVAISGAAIMVGAYSDFDNGWNSGSAYVFDCDCNDNGVFDLVDLVEGTSQDCTGNQIPDECEPDCNGNAVADSCDIAAGTSEDSNGNVIPDECELVDGSCTETKLLASDGGSNDRFGTSVALSGDVLVVGAEDDDNENGAEAGSVYVYRLVGADWIEEAKLLASDGESDDSFGYSVAVDGDVILVGAARDDSGSVYVYRFDGTDWIQETKLVQSDAGIDDTFFGSSVAIDGALAVVGASGFATGSAYIYRFDGSDWVEEAELLASDGQEGDLFGQSVAVSGDTAIIGAYWDMDNAINPGSGSAYVYRFDGLDWIEQIKLVPADNADGDMFGYAVAMSGDLAIIGAPADDPNGQDSGSAYVYSREGTDWVELAKLVASDGAGDDDFGWSVGITGHWVIVGARRDDENATNSGSAYLYRFDGIHWTEAGKFLASDGGWSDWFGSSVAISGAVVVLGASGDDDNGIDAGSAYVFVCDCNGNGMFDTDDILEGTSQDCSGNQIPDECEPDCNGNAVADSCDIVAGTSLDCNVNGIPDECIELEDDCNANGHPDQCDVADGDSPDCNGNGVPDEC